jgi:hypothetical protein
VYRSDADSFQSSARQWIQNPTSVDRRQSAEFQSSETKSPAPAKPAVRKPANPIPGVAALLPEQKGSSPLGQEAATSPPGKAHTPSSKVSRSAAQSSGAKIGGDLQRGTSGGVPAASGTERKAAGILPAPEKKGSLARSPGPSSVEDIGEPVDKSGSGNQKEGGRRERASTAANQGNATGSSANGVNKEDAVSSKEIAVDNASCQKGAEGANRAVEGVVRGAVMGQDKGPDSTKGESVLGPPGRSGSEKCQNGPAPAPAVARPSGSKSKLSVSAPPFVPKSMQFSKPPASSDSSKEAAKQVKQMGLTNLSTATEAKSVDLGISQGVRRCLSSGPLASSSDRVVVTPLKRESAIGKPPSKAATAGGPTSGTPPSLPPSKAPQQDRSGNPPSVGITPLAAPQKALGENGRQHVLRNSSSEAANKHVDLVVGTIRVPHLDMVPAGVTPSRVSLVVGKGRPSRETRQLVVSKESTSADAAMGKEGTGAQAGQVASKESERRPSEAKERVDRSLENGHSTAGGGPVAEMQPEAPGGAKGSAEGCPSASDDVSRALADAPPRGPESKSSSCAAVLEGSEVVMRVPPKPVPIGRGTPDPKAAKLSGAGSGGNSMEQEQPGDPSPSPELLATESGKVGRKSKPRRLSLVARQQALKVPKQTGGELDKPAVAQNKKKATGGAAAENELISNSKEGSAPSKGGVDRVAENGAMLLTDGLGPAELREAEVNCSGVASDDRKGLPKVTSEENAPMVEQRRQEARPDPSQRDSQESNVEEPRQLETAYEPADLAVMLSPEDSTESAGVGGSGKGDSRREQEGAAEGGEGEDRSGETGGSNAGDGNQGGAGNGDGGEERDGKERGGEKKGGNDASKREINRKKGNKRELGGEDAHEVERAEGMGVMKSAQMDGKERRSNSLTGSFASASKDLVVAEEESSKEDGEVAGKTSPLKDGGPVGGLPHPEEWGDVNEDRSIFRQRLWSYLFEVSFKETSCVVPQKKRLSWLYSAKLRLRPGNRCL